MKLSYVIRGALFFLVALSLVLTWTIWTMPNKTENIKDLNGNKTEANTILKESDVFAPNQLIYHNEEQAISTTNVDLMTRLEKELGEWRYSSIKEYKVLGEGYADKLNEKNTLELAYSTARPFSTINGSFSKLASNYKEQSFQRIVIPLNDSGNIYFFNDATTTMYTSEISDFSKESVMELLTTSERPLVEVNLQKLSETYVYLPKDEAGLSILSYISEPKTSLEVRNRLFDDLSEITSSSSQDKTVEQYYDNVSKVSINKETNILTYNRSSTSMKMSKQDVLRYSLSELRDFDIWPGRTRFFQYNETKQQVVYRRYIEDLPVFGVGGTDHDSGGTYLTIAKDGVLSRMQMSLTIAQTPVFSKLAEKKLASGSELIANLDALGYSANEIEDIQLGYAWTKSLDSADVINDGSGSEKIVDFVPGWYVLIKGTWYNVKELSAKNDGRDNEGGL